MFGPCRLAAVVQLVFHRVRCVFVGVDLFPLQFHVAFELVLGEDVALEQEVVVRLQLVEDVAQGPRNLLDLQRLFGGQVVQVLVQGIARIDFILNCSPINVNRCVFIVCFDAPCRPARVPSSWEEK